MKSPAKAGRRKSKRSRKAKSRVARKKLTKKKPTKKKLAKKAKRGAPRTKKKKPTRAIQPKAVRAKPQRGVPTAAAAEALAPAPAAADPPGMACSNGWRITGYYTPLETDFHGAPQQITVAESGTDSFPGDFLAGVRMEGWGQTRYGWFLGFDSGHYSSVDAPQSARGKPLAVGSLAVDKNEIPFGNSVRIPGLPAPWNNQLFVADDVGSMINQKHVDVYCGTGANARAQTMRITNNNQRLCQS